MADLLPDRGGFRFPAPYGTFGVRVTNETDGDVRPIGMAYWPNLNYSAGLAELRVLVSIYDDLVIFAVDKASGHVRREMQLPYRSTGEGCYWSIGDPDRVYIPVGDSLIAHDISSGIRHSVYTPGRARQWHTSGDGTVHSLTLDDAPAVSRRGAFERYSVHVPFDECHIDRSGRWLLLKEGDDNSVIDLYDPNVRRVITNAGGAVGHSDMGFGYMVGEDDYADQPGAFRLWTFGDEGLMDLGIVYHQRDWAPMMRYVSHANARPIPPDMQTVLFSSSYDGDAPRANELVTARLDGSNACRVMCPNLTVLRGAPGSDERYWSAVRANIDPLGEWACWSGNHGTDRQDVFLVRL